MALTEFIAPCGSIETTAPRQVRGMLSIRARFCFSPSISTVPFSTTNGERAVSEMIEPRVDLPLPDSPASPSTSPS